MLTPIISTLTKEASTKTYDIVYCLSMFEENLYTDLLTHLMSLSSSKDWNQGFCYYEAGIKTKLKTGIKIFVILEFASYYKVPFKILFLNTNLLIADKQLEAVISVYPS